MSAANGKRKIVLGGKIGTRVFQFADTAPEVTLDVIHISNLWFEIDQQFRLPDGKVDESKLKERAQEAIRFAAELLQVDLRDMDLASAFHFIKVVDDEVEELKPFFVPRSAAKPSSPASTDVIFST